MKRNKATLKAHIKFLKQQNTRLKKSLRLEQEAHSQSILSYQKDWGAQEKSMSEMIVKLQKEIAVLNNLIDRFRGKKWYQFIPLKKRNV